VTRLGYRPITRLEARITSEIRLGSVQYIDRSAEDIARAALGHDEAGSSEAAARGEKQLHGIRISLCSCLNEPKLSELLKTLRGHYLYDPGIAHAVALPCSVSATWANEFKTVC